MASTARQSNRPFARITAACAALLVAGVLLQSPAVRAESFEVVSYTPPRGWSVHDTQVGKVYVRPDGQGVIVFNAGRYENPIDNPGVAFVVAWRELVERITPAPAPTPKIARQRDYTVAKGIGPVFFNGKPGAASLFAICGTGRRLGVVSIATSDVAGREIDAFFLTVVVTDPVPVELPPSALIGKWWKDAGSFYERYEFTSDGFFSYQTPARGSQTGTYRVDGDRLILTDSTGRTTSRTYRIRCVAGDYRLELAGEHSYQSTQQRC